jgi:hypothetical protein
MRTALAIIVDLSKGGIIGFLLYSALWAMTR